MPRRGSRPARSATCNDRRRAPQNAARGARAGDPVEQATQAELEVRLGAELELRVCPEMRGVAEEAQQRRIAPAGFRLLAVGVEDRRPAALPFLGTPLELGPLQFTQNRPAHIVIDSIRNTEASYRIQAQVGDSRQREFGVGEGVRAEARGDVQQRDQPGVTVHQRPHLPGEQHEIGAPVAGGVLGECLLAEDGVENEVEQFLLAGDVPVERHCADAEPGGDPAHRDGLGTFLVGHLDRRPDDHVTVERPALAARRVFGTQPDRVERAVVRRVVQLPRATVGRVV
jgi:hypothetical protein